MNSPRKIQRFVLAQKLYKFWLQHASLKIKLQELKRLKTFDFGKIKHRQLLSTAACTLHKMNVNITVD